jgi:hypothetical protein
MKAFRSVGLLVVVLLATTFSSIPGTALAVRPESQTADNITGDGQFCDDDIGFCGEFHITFHPIGGPVTGSFSSRYANEAGEVLQVNGTLTGTFTGGDGGAVNGTIVSGVWDWTCPTCDFVLATPASLAGRNWNGYLYADGTGAGLLMDGIPWNVAFSADDFQADLILPTPTRIAVQATVLQLDPAARDYIASSLPLDEATTTILGQDAVLIARDSKNGFYAIDNNGQSVPLSAELKSMFKLSDRFAILENRRLLDSFDLTPQSDSINGGSQSAILEKMPPDLKDRDYLKVSANCTGGSPPRCNTLMQINSTAASFQTCTLPTGGPAPKPVVLPPPVSDGGKAARLSSEHGCVRGTINGGGDFIRRPGMGFPNSVLAGYSGGAIRQAAPAAYLGASVEMRTEGAEITQIQTGSPADLAGLNTGDIIQQVDGQAVNPSNPLDARIAQFSAGEKVELTVLREGETRTAVVTLAEFTEAVIRTPSAEITVEDYSLLTVDIGFNGYTGVYVIDGRATVRELIGGTQTEVSAGEALIVAPGRAIDPPVAVDSNDVNAWWQDTAEYPGIQATDAPPAAAGSSASQSSNPPPASLPGWLILVAAGACCGGIAVVLVLILILVWKKKRR